MKPAQSGTAKPELDAEREPIFFAAWHDVLERSTESEEVKMARKSAIFGFLKFCKTGRNMASIAIMKEYFRFLEAQGKPVEEARESLRWFVKLARAQARSAPDEPARNIERNKVSAGDRALPSAGSADLGTTEWERALIKAVRVRG